VPFYVAAPVSTFDLELATGADIPIEERDPREILFIGEYRVAPDGAEALNPAFDVTPAALVTGYITDRGILTAADLAGAVAAPSTAAKTADPKPSRKARTKGKAKK